MTALKIIVTGAHGQLGMEFKDLSKDLDYDFTFLSSSDLDISSRSQVIDYFTNQKVDIILNCAAYTKVDLAETEKTKAYDVNANGVKNLLEAMSDQCLMLHYSTDYVYNAELGTAIKENEATYPSNVYAASKLSGDQHVIKSNKKAIVLRTSWVYSSYGNNFVKTMLRLADRQPEIKVVNDQIGAPTFAQDLASASMSILNKMLLSEDITLYNKVYHYSNKGQISWYDFAKEIFAHANKDILLYPIPTSEYPRQANRPVWSVLDCNLIQKKFGVEVMDWKQSLAVCLEKLV